MDVDPWFELGSIQFLKFLTRTHCISHEYMVQKLIFIELSHTIYSIINNEFNWIHTN